MPVHPETGEYTTRYSQAARDADKAVPNLRTESYADYIEHSSLEHCAYFVIAGDFDKAREMLTQSLGQSLIGNDGD